MTFFPGPLSVAEARVDDRCGVLRSAAISVLKYQDNSCINYVPGRAADERPYTRHEKCGNKDVAVK